MVAIDVALIIAGLLLALSIVEKIQIIRTNINNKTRNNQENKDEYE